MVKAIRTALDARRQRIVVSESTVGRVRWAGILLMGLFTLVAIAMVHSDNRLTCAIALTLFASGIALSLLLIAAYSRPFTGEISVKPDLLRQVITSGQPLLNHRDPEHVRFGSLADIGEVRDVRFTPESRHTRRRHRCPLCASRDFDTRVVWMRRSR